MKMSNKYMQIRVLLNYYLSKINDRILCILFLHLYYQIWKLWNFANLGISLLFITFCVLNNCNCWRQKVKKKLVIIILLRSLWRLWGHFNSMTSTTIYFLLFNVYIAFQVYSYSKNGEVFNFRKLCTNETEK